MIPINCVLSETIGQGCARCADTLRLIICDYTREVGVRNLEREIVKVFHHTAVRIAEDATTFIGVSVADLASILGPHRFENEVALRSLVCRTLRPV